eukprot:4059290-Pyramimonas_sp.AAC.1
MFHPSFSSLLTTCRRYLSDTLLPRAVLDPSCVIPELCYTRAVFYPSFVLPELCYTRALLYPSCVIPELC